MGNGSVLPGHHAAAEAAGGSELPFSFDGPAKDLYCMVDLACGDAGGSKEAGKPIFGDFIFDFFGKKK